MKIPPHYTSRMNRGIRPPPAAKQKIFMPRSRKLREDKVTVSPLALEVYRFTEIAKRMPDVRQEKIQDIKDRLAAGTYSVAPEAVARSIGTDDASQQDEAASSKLGSLAVAAIDHVPTVREFIDSIVREAEEILDSWQFLKTR